MSTEPYDHDVWCSRCGARQRRARGRDVSGWQWTGNDWEHRCADLEGQEGHFPAAHVRLDSGACRRHLRFGKAEPRRARRESFRRFWRRLSAGDHPALRKKPRGWRRASVRDWYGEAKQASGREP